MPLFSGRQFWLRPREVLLRRLLFQLHVWIGLSLGLYIAVMGLSGVILLFRDEIEEITHPEIFHVGEHEGPGATVPVLLASARAAFPGAAVTSVYAPTHDRQTWVAYVQTDSEIVYAYLHPITARVVATTSPSTSVLHWIQDLHFNLLNGKPGRTVNGVGGLLLLALCVSGFFIWWPGAANWKSALTINAARRWKRVNWELHSAVGVWALLALAMWGFTGYYFGYSAFVVSVVNRFSALSQTTPPESQAASGKRSTDLDQLLKTAANLAPAGHFYGVQLPPNRRAAITVFMARVTPAVKADCDYLYFDQYSGEYIKTWRRGVSVSMGDRIVNSFVPLHFGTFAGLPLRWIWFVLGLAPPLLFGTGVLMWWNRVLRPRWSNVAGTEREAENAYLRQLRIARSKPGSERSIAERGAVRDRRK